MHAPPKIIKNDQNTKSTNQIENLPKKTYIQYPKYQTELSGSAQNHKKNYQNTNSTNQIENFAKKTYVYYLKSKKEPNIHTTEFAGSTNQNEN
jgi:hypothetical protein